MKTTLLLLTLIVLSNHLLAQKQEPVRDKRFYEIKEMKYTRLKKTGVGLTVAGSVFAIAGIITLSNAETDSYGLPIGNKALIGWLSIIGGVGMLSPGIPLAIIGSIKSKKYHEKVNSFSLETRLTPQELLSLTFKF